MNTIKKEKISEVLKELGNLHYCSGLSYTKKHKVKVSISTEDNKLGNIYNLVESHTPNLRFTTIHRFEKVFGKENEELSTNSLTLNKKYLDFICNTSSIDDNIKNMLDHIEEMPKEWTLVQLTSQYNIQENIKLNIESVPTNGLHIIVFNCGRSNVAPYMITLDPPIDKISGKIIEIRQEMNSLIKDNLQSLRNAKALIGKKYYTEKQAYSEARTLLNSRLENLIKEIQNKYLGEWRCLLYGKFIDKSTEEIINAEIVDTLKNTQKSDIKEDSENFLLQLFKAGDVLSTTEIKKALLYLFPNQAHKGLRVTLAKKIQVLSKKHNFIEKLRYPVILIIDEKLDALPWEMIDVLTNQPISRMPSLHFTYALFKEHQKSIKNGFKININSKNGKYLVNPGLDLKNMESRLKSFFNYWLPGWNGLVGITPSENEFKNMLSEGDIFVYSGHGDGTQFLAGEKIQKMRINKVVLLFGCSSAAAMTLGPQIQMYGSYQMYLIACSPCIVGMLWPVTDVETDLLTTEFLSQWIKSSAPCHWKQIEKKKWETEGTVSTNKGSEFLSESEKHEPELLRALCKAKKATRQIWTKAACVVRGLPVKIKQ